MTIRSVAPDKAYRLLNHGPTTLISAKHNGIENVMSASWVCVLDLLPAKVTAVLSKESYTRELVEKSNLFAVQIPVVAQANSVMAAGSLSRHNCPTKLADSAISLFYQDGFDVPLVNGCAAWLICRLIPEAHNQQTYDLLIGEVLAAWADDQVFSDGHWHFDEVGDEKKTIHHIAGGQFYITGKGLKV